MLVFLLKFISVLAILFLLCFPFIPFSSERIKWTVPNSGYSGKDRWRNVFFVLEAILFFLVVLFVAPYIKRFFLWLFTLGFMVKFVGILPDRFVYTVDVLSIIIINLGLCFLFIALKKFVKKILDSKVFFDVSAGQKKQNKNNKKKIQNTSSNDRSESRLKRLRRKSVLVFQSKKKNKNKHNIKNNLSDNNTDVNTDNGQSPKEKKGFLGLIETFAEVFYSKEENKKYVKFGTFRWANELKYFLIIVSVSYLLVFFAIILPVFYSFDWISWYYTAIEWLIVNTYLYPAIALVLIFEVYYFICGECKKEDSLPDAYFSGVSGIINGKTVDLNALRESLLYQYGEEYMIKEFEASFKNKEGAFSVESQKKYIKQLSKAICKDKKMLNGNYLTALEKMLDGEHVCFDASVYSVLGEYIIHYLFVSLAFGTRALFVCKDKKECEDIKSYIESSFKQITTLPYNMWRITDAEEMRSGKTPDILLLTPEDFVSETLFTDGRVFFEELTDVFVLDADKILLNNNYYCLIMAKKLERAATKFAKGVENGTDYEDSAESLKISSPLKYRFFVNGSVKSVDTSIRQFFDLKDKVASSFHAFNLNYKTDIFIWRTGAGDTIYTDNAGNQVTLGAFISGEASKADVPEINLITERDVYDSYLHNTSGLVVNRCTISKDKPGFVVVDDDNFNLPKAIYSYSRFTGREASVLHIVSRPYLLREYFVSKAEQYVTTFSLISETMTEHAEQSRAKMIVLLCDALGGIEEKEFIRRTKENSPDCGDTLESCVKACYAMAFGVDNDKTVNYHVEKRLGSDLVEQHFVFIHEDKAMFNLLLESTKQITVKYENTETSHKLPVFQNEIVQNYLPNQVIYIRNHSYTVKEVNKDEGYILVDDTRESINVPLDYVQTRIYNISKATGCGKAETIIENRNINFFNTSPSGDVTPGVGYVDLSLFDCNVEVDTVGYFPIEQSSQAVRFQSPSYTKYYRLNNLDRGYFKRNMENAKVLVCEMGTNVENNPKATYLLCVILQEVMKTLFPRNYRTVSVCPLFNSKEDEKIFDTDANSNFKKMYPWLESFPEDMVTAETHEFQCASKMRFAIIEDVEGGNGIIESLLDADSLGFQNLLAQIADYLNWLGSIEGKEDKYLNFGMDTPPDVFDFEVLAQLLSQFREKIEVSKPKENKGDNCFFCHCSLDDGKFVTLTDGRKICEDCQNTTTDTFEELDEIFNSVKKAILDGTSVADTFPKNISVDFVSTEELVSRFGADNEIPIGFCNHVTNCIYVEYGLPRVAAIALVANLITELWQDKNVLSDGSPIYMCHPLYVELQTLTALKHATAATAFKSYYSPSEGLDALVSELEKFGSGDSFAYFLGVGGKNKDPHIIDEIPTIVDRDPTTVPRMYYESLSPSEKAVYDEIYNCIMKHDPNVNLTQDIDFDACSKIIWLLKFDNPHIFWCSHNMASISCDSSQKVKFVSPKYVMDKKEREKCEKKIEKSIAPFLEGIDTTVSDFNVAVRAFENIVKLIDYDSIGLDVQDNDPDSDNKPDHLRSIYGVFCEKKAVCAGYAKAYQYLLTRMGIPCAYVRGDCHEGGAHAWNLVQLEGKKYYVDVTWGDRTNTDARKSNSDEVFFEYFGITTEELLKSRNVDKECDFGTFDAKDCNYFIRNKMYFTAYDSEKIKNLLESTLKSGRKHFGLKTSDENVYDLIFKRLHTNGGLYDIMRSVNSKEKFVYSLEYKDVNVMYFKFDKK